MSIPSRSMIGPAEDCSDELLEMEESFYRMHLSWADHYRVEESASGKRAAGSHKGRQDMGV